MKKFIFTLLLASFSTFSYAVIRYVKPITTGTGDGSSWANASSNLQAMINTSVPFDEIWVAAGTYYPSAFPSGCTTCGTASAGNRNNTFLLKSGVRVYGGFAGTETARLLRNSHLNETILSGDLGVLNEASDNAYHVVTAIDCSDITTLERFTIKNGNANGATSITVAGRTYFRSWGGGVLCVYSPIMIALCAIVENRANDGGGILNTACSPFITNSVIALNIAFAGGGGIYNHEGSATDIRMCTIAQNTADVAGGAMYNYNSNPYIIDVILRDNSSPSLPGIANNGSAVTGYDSNVQDFYGSLAWCTRCFDTEPQFINADFPAGIDGKWGSRDDGLRITSCSPGIDKGRGGSTVYGDMANNNRSVDIPSIPNFLPSSDGTDIGAYEFQNTSPSNQILYVNGSLTTGLNDGSSWENAFRGSNAFGTALKHANNCDNNTILVAKGTYKPHDLPPWFSGSYTSRNYTFSLKSGLNIYGGFDGTGTLSDYSSQKAKQNETILSGDYSDNDVVTGSGGTLVITNNTENAHYILVANSGATQLTIKGFTIRGGASGGLKGGSGFEIADCIFKHNSAVSGGAISSGSSPFVVKNNFFDRNFATNDGGAISYKNAGGLVVTNNVFVGNRAATGAGGAIINDLYYAQFYNNTFYNNSAQTTGGALHTYDPHLAGAFIELCKVYNNIFYKNAIGTNTTSTHADFYITGGNGREFKNNILQFASSQYPTNNSSSNSIGPTAANNLFAVNPLFANEIDLPGPDLLGGTPDDGLRLQRTSSAINVGSNSILIPSDDILSNQRYSIPDIGAYEFQPREACPEYRHIADVPIETGTHYAGFQSFIGSGTPELSKSLRVGATAAFGDGYITSSGTVATGTSVVFDAAKSVTLLPGFQTQSGATFRTNLQGCP